jgi:ABC-type uncharacterized transport system permease subunit
MSPSLLFDPALLQLMFIMATPLLVAALGEMLTEHSGVLNVSIEGMMALGAIAGFLGSYFMGSNAAGIVVAALVTASVLGVALAYSVISLRLPQLTVGLALFVLAVGLASLLYRVAVGVRFVPPQVPTFQPVALPGLSQIPYRGGWLFSLPLPTYLSLILVPLAHFFFFSTPWGLRIRSVGENPRASDLAGIPVFVVRYVATLAGSALIGMAGALLPMLLTGTYSDGIVGGRGWIALMLVIFGRWRPLGALGGALLFAYVEALQFRLGLITKAVPPQFLLMLPYIFAILVLIRIYRGAQAPAALGKAYDREERG